MLYRRFSPAYELVFPLIIKKRIADSIKAMDLREGERVLEIGVGTGVSLDAYPVNCQIVGIDLSEEMLAVSRRKLAKHSWRHIELSVGNAQQLDFPDASFDAVTAFHVVSVVSDPKAMMSEVARVLKPGGRLLLVNHFRSRNPLIANLIDCVDPVTRHLGWRTDLECKALMADLPFQVDKRYKTSPWSLFTVINARRTE